MHQASLDETSVAYSLICSIDSVLNGLTLYLHTFKVPLSLYVQSYSTVRSSAQLILKVHMADQGEQHCHLIWSRVDIQDRALLERKWLIHCQMLNLHAASAGLITACS